MKNFIPNQKLWGRITSDNVNVSGLIIEISLKQFSTSVVGRTMTTGSGKYFLKAAKGDYILRVKNISEENLVTIFEKEISVGNDGVVNENIRIS